MARLQPMRYKDYVWPHNPRTYSISYRRVVATHKVPYGYYTMENLGQSYRVMTGSGEFVGGGAYEEFKKLATVYYTGGDGILVHPCWQSAHVYFVSLKLTQIPQPDYVAYSFEFWEAYDYYDMSLQQVGAGSASSAGSASFGGSAVGGAAAQSAAVYHTVCQGESLWAIALHYGVAFESVLALNSDLKNPNLIYAGQKVRVA